MGWSNVASSVLTANTVIVIAGEPDTGIFVYSGTPAAGNLIMSVAAADGTDPYGNAYGPGIISYATGHTGSIGMNGGELLLGAAPDFTNGGSILQSLLQGGDIQMFTGTGDSNHVDGAHAALTAGINSATTGGATTPNLALYDQDISSPVDLLLSGSLIATSLAGARHVWTAPTSFATGWAQGSGIGGNYPDLMWRYDGLGNIHVHGTFHATVSTPATHIASGFPPCNVYSGGGDVGVLSAAAYVSGTNFVLPLYIDTSGDLWATNDAGLTDATATFVVNASVPLGQLP